MAKVDKEQKAIEKEQKLREQLIEKIETSKKFKDTGYQSNRGWKQEITEVVPTGIPSFDIFTARSKAGIWGIPWGIVMTLFGFPGVAKTQMLFRILAAFQRSEKRPICEYIKVESGPISEDRMVIHGIDTDDLFWNRPDAMQNLWDYIRVKLEIIAASKDALRRPYVVGIDTVSDSPTLEERDASYKEDQGMSRGGHARVNSLKMRQLSNLIDITGAVVICIGQAKSDPNTFGGFVKDPVFIGSAPILFESQLVYLMSRGSDIKNDGEKEPPTGMEVHFKVKKRKNAVSSGKTSVDLDFANGFDECSSLYDALLIRGLVEEKGEKAKFLLPLASGSDLIWNGRDDTKNLPPGALKMLNKSLGLTKAEIEERKG